MKIAELISLLPDGVDAEYRGDLDTLFRGLTVKFDGKLLKGRFAVMLTASWGSERAAKKYFSPEKKFSDHIATALEYDAAGFVLPREYMDDPAVQGLDCFFVDDTTAFAFAVATCVRNSEEAGRITAITGSAGKSTTKAMIAHALRELMPKRAIYSPGSTQNVETSMLRHMTVSHRFKHLVLEVAGSAFRSFKWNTFTVSADVSIVTSISEAHLSYLKNMENIAEVKADIFNAPPPGGTAIINRDTPHSDILVRRAVQGGCQLVTYGESRDATIRLKEYDAASGSVTAEVGDELFTYTVGARGKHMALNSLATIAALRAYGFREWRKAIEALSSFEPLRGRGERVDAHVPGGKITMIDESYNANPASMRAAIQTFQELQLSGTSRKVAVLGDILELGPEAESLHLDLVDMIQKAGFEQVHLVGDHMQNVDAALKDRVGNTLHWTDLDALVGELRSTLREGDAILLKSSHGTGLHEVVARMCATTQSPDR